MRVTEGNVVISSHRRPTFLKVLPTFGKLDIAFHIASERLIMPVNALVESFTLVGEEIGMARNKAVEFVLNRPKEKRPEFIFFFGDDMIPQYDALIRLWEIMRKETWDILSALYYVKQDFYPTPILWRDEIPGYLREGEHYQLGETVETDICGFDFTLCRPEIFEKVGPPWFKTGPTTTNRGGIWVHTEDVWAVKKVQEVGGKVGVATSIRVGHLDTNTGEVY